MCASDSIKLCDLYFSVCMFLIYHVLPLCLVLELIIASVCLFGGSERWLEKALRDEMEGIQVLQ